MTKKLNTIKEQVITILETDSIARDDDNKLYVEICRMNDPKILKCSFEEAMLHQKEYNVPSYASVERARRKVQSERPDLVGTVKELRKSLEPDYVDFALN